MDQRLIVRIQLLLPIYAISSWLGLHHPHSLISKMADPIREIYEAFVIYTFFTLLTNILGGERDIIISTSGRAPKEHLFPINYCAPKVDISDPYTFLGIKRGILQYTWLKPLLSLAGIVLGVFPQSSTFVKSAYLWVALIYNVSISISLYCLALFWYCLLDDLKPYRPLPKFLCIKIIIFFSYWQGFFLSIFVWLGLIPSNEDAGIGANDLANAIQNGLMCLEMFGFAIGHWIAFSYQDYATTALIGFARLPAYYAIRDTFGCVDLVLDFKSTFWGKSYGYRQFDSIENVLEHPESASRRARLNAGLRYRNGGRSRYWLPQSSQKKNMSIEQHQQLLYNNDQQTYGTTIEPPSPIQPLQPNDPTSSAQPFLSDQEFAQDETIYAHARKLRYGDYNYPVITVRESVPYRSIIDQQLASGVKTTLEQEYESFAPPTEEDYDF